MLRFRGLFLGGNFVLLCLALVAPNPLKAQAIGRPISSVPSALLVKNGDMLRVVAGGDRLQGALTRIEGDSTLSLETMDAPIAMPEIDSLWVRGRSTKGGALMGGLTTGILFSLAFIDVCGRTPNDCANSDARGAIGPALLIGAFGTLPGAAVGALIGSLIPSWRLRYTSGGGWTR